MATVAIANQKGGVGKTATALGIVSALRAKSRRVLVVDLDPQGNATAGLGIDVTDTMWTSGDVIKAGEKGAAAQAVTLTTWGDGVDCIPSNTAVANRNRDANIGDEFRLRKALQGIDGYDLILLDCPPSVAHLTSNALVAADYALLVTEAAADSISGLSEVRKTIELIKEHHNPRLTIAGVVVNDLADRSEQRYRLDELTSTYGPLVWEPYVPRRAVIADAKGARAAVHDYGYRSKDVASIYEALADRLLQLELAE